jgi:hypothetical protein
MRDRRRHQSPLPNVVTEDPHDRSVRAKITRLKELRLAKRATDKATETKPKKEKSTRCEVFLTQRYRLLANACIAASHS